MPKCAKRLHKIKGVETCLEDDIRYSMRYLVDNNVNPCGWNEIEVEESENKLGVQVDGVYLAKSFPHGIESTQVLSLKVLGFSIIIVTVQRELRNQKMILSHALSLLFP